MGPVCITWCAPRFGEHLHVLEAVYFSLMPSSNVQALHGFSDSPKLAMVGSEKFVEDDACPPPQNSYFSWSLGLRWSARKLEHSCFWGQGVCGACIVGLCKDCKCLVRRWTGCVLIYLVTILQVLLSLRPSFYAWHDLLHTKQAYSTAEQHKAVVCMTLRQWKCYPGLDQGCFRGRTLRSQYYTGN